MSVVRGLTWPGVGGSQRVSLHGRPLSSDWVFAWWKVQGELSFTNIPHSNYSPRAQLLLQPCWDAWTFVAWFGLLFLSSLIELYLYNIKFTHFEYTIQLHLIPLPSVAVITINQFQNIFNCTTRSPVPVSIHISTRSSTRPVTYFLILYICLFFSLLYRIT